MTRSSRPDPSVQAAEIDRVLTSLSRRLSAVSGGAAVAAVAQAAVYHVAGARWAGVSLLAQGRFRTLVATAPVAQQADALQYDLRSGPLADPASGSAVHLAGDLSRDRRWPDFSARAAQRLGLAGLVVYRLPLPEDPGTTVGLSLYSDVPDAFDVHALWAGSLLASHCVQAVSAQQNHRRVLQLQHGLGSAREVGTAAGVLMARHGVSREDALRTLHAAGKDAGRSAAEVATEIIDTGGRYPPAEPAGPPTEPVSPAQGARRAPPGRQPDARGI